MQVRWILRLERGGRAGARLPHLPPGLTYEQRAIAKWGPEEGSLTREGLSPALNVREEYDDFDDEEDNLA